MTRFLKPNQNNNKVFLKCFFESMSQVSELNIYFLLPKEDKNAECSKDMCDAFTCVKQYRGKPQWVLPSFCLTRKTSKLDVYVFDAFEGPAFEKLKKESSKYVIIGAKCLLQCMGAGDSIPPGTSPIFTEGMRGLLVCYTGFDSNTRKKIQERVEYMGGIAHNTLRSIITHVVAHNNISLKAIEAFKAGKPVMTKDWVEAVWQRSQVANVRGSDPEFDKYISPLFHNLKITTTGIAKKKKERLKNLIMEHGGTFSVQLESTATDILLADAPGGEKFKAAKQWNIRVLRPSWIQECIAAGKILPLADFEVAMKKASTPIKGDVNFTGNFSLMSAIGNDATHIEESGFPLSQPVASQSVPPSYAGMVDEIVERSANAGQFLDGCNIYLSGFGQSTCEKLKRVLNIGGATRFDELTRAVSHVITTNVASEDTSKHSARILPLDWLLESAKLKRPAPIDGFVENPVVEDKAAPPSPLSKQGAMLLSRPEPRNLAPELEDDGMDELLQCYHLSQPGEPIVDKPVQNLSQNKSQSCSRSQFSQTNKELFQNLRFFLSSDLQEEEYTNADKLITDCGGCVVNKKYSGVPNYAVVSVAGASLVEVTALEVVNLLFLKDCIEENRIVEIQYYHRPVCWKTGATPLTDLVISVSRYVGSERNFVEALIDLLGAIDQPTFSRIKKSEEILAVTHVVCPEPVGPKYIAAIKWNVPAVHHDWLLKCAETGIKVPVDDFLVLENKEASTIGKEKKSESVVANSSSHSAAPAVVRQPSISPAVAREPSTSPAVAREPSSISAAVAEEPSTSRIPAVQPANVLVEKSSNVIERQTSVCTPEVTKTPLQLSYTSFQFPPDNERRDSQPPKTATPAHLDLDRTNTPDTPYGAFYGHTPSPATRKRLKRWMNRGLNTTMESSSQSRREPEKTATPVSELVSRQLKLMMRRPEDRPSDDSPDLPAAKRINFGPSDDVLSGLQKMREIEESYSRNSSPVTVPIEKHEEPKLVVVTESQPNTEIGWDDPTDRLVSSYGKRLPTPPASSPKMFMLSGVNDSGNMAKNLIESCGGKLSSLAIFDSSATHLIGGAKMARAEKLMGSIAAGLWVLHPSYLDKLASVKDVHGVKEEDFEWGNPKNSFLSGDISKVVAECLSSAYYWRNEIKQDKNKTPFNGMVFIFKMSQGKADIFKRIVLAGGGKIQTMEEVELSSNVYCILEGAVDPKELHSMAKMGIRCVTTIFISDFITRKPNAVKENYVKGFEEVWTKYH